MLIGLALLTAFRLAGTSALNVFFYLATIGTLSLVVMYVLTNVAAAWHLGERSWWQVVRRRGCAHCWVCPLSQRLRRSSSAV